MAFYSNDKWKINPQYLLLPILVLFIWLTQFCKVDSWEESIGERLQSSMNNSMIGLKILEKQKREETKLKAN